MLSLISFAKINCKITVGGMASKGLKAISYQGTRNVEASYNPSYTSETLIGYTACYQLFNCFLKPMITHLLLLLYFSKASKLNKKIPLPSPAPF